MDAAAAREDIDQSSRRSTFGAKEFKRLRPTMEREASGRIDGLIGSI
jgi:hypothetical protein